MAIDIFGNATSGTQADWVPEPARRGTWSILSTCIITLILCVWSAVHMNVPEYQQARFLSIRASVWRKVGWCVLGWLAPEVVAFIAWTQLRQAIVVRKEFNKILRRRRQKLPWWKRYSLKAWLIKPKYNVKDGYDLAQSQTFRRHAPWTISHGFLGTMGGFAVEYPGARGLVNKYALSLEGVLFLIRVSPQTLPILSLDEIEDGSKVNALAKAVTCFQTVWFCVQSLYRMTTDFPISLLELNTFGHAVCALITWLLWWHKPFDLAKTFVIRPFDTDDMTKMTLSHMRLVSRDGLRGDYIEAPDLGNLEVEYMGEESYAMNPTVAKIQIRSLSQVPETSPERPIRPQFMLTPEVGESNSTDAIPRQVVTRSSSPTPELPANQSPFSISPVQTSGPTPDKMRPTSEGSNDATYNGSTKITIELGAFFPGNIFRNVGLRTVSLTSQDATNWELVSQLYARSRPKAKRFILSSIISRELLIKPRIRNFSLALRESEMWPLFWILLATSIVYGGLHGLAWTALFPSKAEELMWRISTVAVMGGLPGVTMLIMFAAFIRGFGSRVFASFTAVLTPHFDRFEPPFYDNKGGIMSEVTALLGYLAGVFLIALYKIARLLYLGAVSALSLVFTFGRVYFIIESFIQLFHLPLRAFDVPRWSQYIPHIS